MVRLWLAVSSMNEVPAPPRFMLGTVNTLALYKPDLPESRLKEFTFCGIDAAAHGCIQSPVIPCLVEHSHNVTVNHEILTVHF